MSEPQPTTCYTSACLYVQTTDQQNTLPPPWLAEALLIAQLWRASGLVTRLQQQVRPERGRMGHYLVCDFVLMLLAYALRALLSFMPGTSRKFLASISV